MYNVLTVLIILACVFLVLIVLVQNPKGSGLGASFGGGGNQMMGVQRTTDFLEKGTWYLAIGLLVLSLATSFFVERGDGGVNQTQVQEQMDIQGPVDEE